MRRRPGEVRDAIVSVLKARPGGASVLDITHQVRSLIGEVPASSVRSYLQLNTPALFARMDRAQYCLKGFGYQPKPATEQAQPREFRYGEAALVQADCLNWLEKQPANSIHAVVSDPPYGLVEYSDTEQRKLRAGKGGIWRIPPSFDGTQRSPLPRFTVLKQTDLDSLEEFFSEWAARLLPVLVPGANVVIASNPLLSYLVSNALSRAGLVRRGELVRLVMTMRGGDRPKDAHVEFSRRGELVRLVMTMRGGDRPKDAHVEFSNVSVMPRSMWEPWVVFRKGLDGRVQDNLRKWGTGGFRRVSADRPFGDVITSSPTRPAERALAPHPSLKPQAFLRQLVRGVLPLGKGVVLDPFAGAGSTLAAAEALGYTSVGVEKDAHYFDIAVRAIPKLAALSATGD